MRKTSSAVERSPFYHRYCVCAGGIVFAVPFDFPRARSEGGAVPVVEARRPADGAATRIRDIPTGSVDMAVPIGMATGERVLAWRPPEPCASPGFAGGRKCTFVRRRDGARLDMAATTARNDRVDSELAERARCGGHVAQNRFPIWSPDGKRVDFNPIARAPGSYRHAPNGNPAGRALTKAFRTKHHVHGRVADAKDVSSP